MSIKNKPEAWQVRKLGYGLAAVIVAILGWVGVLSNIQADQSTGQVDRWLPIILGVTAPALAASKTHAGSDDTATAQDVVAATQTTVVDAVQRAVDAAVAALPTADPQKIGAAVVESIRAEERGEHGISTIGSVYPGGGE